MEQNNSNLKNIALGKTIRYYRIANDMKEKDVAKKLELTAAYVSAIENGKRNVTVENLKKLANIFGVKASDICYIQECLINKNLDYQEALLETLKICLSYRCEN